MRYAIINSKFHGGGILFETSSPREAYKWRRANHDGCHNQRGCESYGISDDNGETWWLCDIIRDSSEWAHCGPGDHLYSDGVYIVADCIGIRQITGDEPYSAMDPQL